MTDLSRLTNGMRLDQVHVIPVSALEGDNVVERSTKTPWYTGPTLIELLEQLPAIDELESENEAFRFPVQLVIRPQGGLAPSVDTDEFRDYRGYAGQISSGVVKVGDSVEIVPGNYKTKVVGIDIAGKSVDQAFAPQSVNLRLAEEFDVARGAVIGASNTLPESVNLIEAEVFWLDPRSVEPGARVLVKTGTSTVQAVISQVIGRRNLDTLAIDPADKIEVNDIAHVMIKLAAALPFDDYRDNRRAGAFLIIQPQDGATLGAGIHTNLELVNFSI